MEVRGAAAEGAPWIIHWEMTTEFDGEGITRVDMAEQP